MGILAPLFEALLLMSVEMTYSQKWPYGCEEGDGELGLRIALGSDL
jgi:hypothetical protein